MHFIIVVQPLIAANALDSIDTNFGDAQKSSEWQNSILTSNMLVTKLFNKSTKSTLPAASRSLVLNSAAASSSPGSNRTPSTWLMKGVAQATPTAVIPNNTLCCQQGDNTLVE
jgi:hypothetical protein